MKIIKKFAMLVNHLRNGEHYEFYYEIIRFVSLISSSLGDLSKVWLLFVNAFQHEDDVYKHSAKASETKYISKANAERKNVFAFIKMTIETALLGADPAGKEAAVKLSEILDNFKKIPFASMTETSALITNMIQDLRLPKYATPLGVLALTATVNRLEDLNENFIDLYAEREDSRIYAEQRGSMREVRPKTDKAFARFIETLNVLYALAVSNGNAAMAEVYEKIITKVNAVVKQYETIYAHRGGATPGNSAPDDDDSDDGGGNLPPDLPGSNAPILAVASQEVLSDTAMYIYPAAADADAFAQALYPAAAGGVLLLEQAGEAPVLFPVTGFKTESEGGADTVKALEVASPSANHSFISPFTGEGPCQAWVEKDGEELARFTGMAYPLMLVLDAEN
ncbi:MAG: DUF6261 family protein [Tannerellaceae bacterium]|jgi:hypothetical protein|nr:DUF6261 family protein [Tannerellaceae bacterium]